MFKRSLENNIANKKAQNKVVGSTNEISDHYFGGKTLLGQNPKVVVNPVGEDLIKRHSEAMSNKSSVQNATSHQQNDSQLPHIFDTSTPQLYANLLAATRDFSEPILRVGGIPLLSFGYDLFSKLYDPISSYLRQSMNMHKTSSDNEAGKKAVKEVTRKLTRKLKRKFLKKLVLDDKIASHKGFEDNGLMIEKSSFYQDLDQSDRIKYLYLPMQQQTRSRYGLDRETGSNTGQQNASESGRPVASVPSRQVGVSKPISDDTYDEKPLDPKDLKNRIIRLSEPQPTSPNTANTPATSSPAPPVSSAYIKLMKALGRRTLPSDRGKQWYDKLRAGFDYATKGYENTPNVIAKENIGSGKTDPFNLGVALGALYSHIAPPHIRTSADDLENLKAAISHLMEIPIEDRKALVNKIDEIDREILEKTKGEALKLGSKLRKGLITAEEARSELEAFSNNLLANRRLEFGGQVFTGGEVDDLKKLLYLEEAVRWLERKKNIEDRVISAELEDLSRSRPFSALLLYQLRGMSPETLRKIYFGESMGNRLYLKNPIIVDDGRVVDYVYTPPIGRDMIVNTAANTLTNKLLQKATKATTNPAAISAASEAAKAMTDAALRKGWTGARLWKGVTSTGKGIKSLIGLTPHGLAASAIIDPVTEPWFMTDMDYETGGDYIRNRARQYIPAFLSGDDPTYILPVGHDWTGPTGSIFRHSMDTLGAATNAMASPITALAAWASALSRSTGMSWPRYISDPIAVLYTRLSRPEVYGAPLEFIPNYMDELDQWLGLGMDMMENHVIKIMDQLPDAEVKLSDGSLAKWKDLTKEQKFEYAKGVANELREDRKRKYEKMVSPMYK